MSEVWEFLFWFFGVLVDEVFLVCLWGKYGIGKIVLINDLVIDKGWLLIIISLV